MPTIDDLGNPLGYQQLTVSTTSVTLTVPTGARFATITLDATNGVRWRDDGTAPTAAIGMPVAGGATFDYPNDPSRLKFIRSGAADAIVNVAYYD